MLDRRGALILALVLLVASILRLWNLAEIPCGLHQDESANAWNAYCILKTGKDQGEISWPIFYSHGLGSNRATLYVYLLIPFQAIGGLNVLTTRLPAALAGILTVWLIYYVARRLSNARMALWAAALLALNPWHIQQSRWGQEAAVCALLGLAPLALMLWARLPMTRDDDLRPSVLRAAIAGLVSAIGCYGYHALKMFIPLFVVGIVLCTLPAWWRSLKTRRGALAIVVFLVSFWAAFGPLAFKFVTEPEIVGKRGQDVSLWKETDSTLQKIDKSSSRYVRHFGPDFLFVDGDDHVLGALPGPEGFVWRALPTLPGNGQFHWYMLPLMLAGCVAVLRRLKSSYAARIVLIYVLVYPIGDCLFRHHAYIRDSLHALRSSPGLCGLVLLAAFGIDEWRLWLKRLERTSVRFARVATRAVLAVFAASLVGLNVPFLYMYFNEYYERASVYDVFQADLIEACDWLQPRLDGVDAVFFTVLGMNMPYSPVLVRLAYDPVRWFHEPREFTNPTGKWDIYTRMGKLYFLYETLDARAAITRIRSENPDARILFVVRPDNPNFRTPIHTILRPDGQEALWICEL